MTNEPCFSSFPRETGKREKQGEVFSKNEHNSFIVTYHTALEWQTITRHFF